jgi:hypothetical protein
MWKEQSGPRGPSRENADEEGRHEEETAGREQPSWNDPSEFPIRIEKSQADCEDGEYEG